MCLGAWMVVAGSLLNVRPVGLVHWVVRSGGCGFLQRVSVLRARSAGVGGAVQRHHWDGSLDGAADACAADACADSGRDDAVVAEVFGHVRLELGEGAGFVRE